jgi:NTE family protein
MSIQEIDRPIKPVFGLALGGGIARGWTHIGVLRALTRAGFTPDIVCGTSIGAVVGGFYLSGHLDELEEWARSLSKRRMISYLDIITRGSGLFAGKKLENLMRDYLHETMIEELNGKFAAIATEMATGHEIWIQKGSLVDAIRASYALPAVFPPFKHNNRWLIDGALVNPVPVSVCRALGARLVVGVTLSADAFGKSSVQTTNEFAEMDFDANENNGGNSFTRKMSAQRLMMRQIFGTGQKSPGIGTVMLSSLNIVMDRLSRSRMAGDPPDVLITPRIGHFSLLEFDKADEMIALGESAVEHILPQLDETISILSN